MLPKHNTFVHVFLNFLIKPSQKSKITTFSTWFEVGKWVREREKEERIKLFQENVHMYRHIFFLKLYEKCLINFSDKREKLKKKLLNFFL